MNNLCPFHISLSGYATKEDTEKEYKSIKSDERKKERKKERN